MAPITVTILDEEMSRARLGLLLQHFSELEDDREPWRVMCPLKEVLLLVTCGTIASCAISTTLSSRASISSTSCGGSRSSITAFRASSGCASWSPGSTRLGRCFEQWVAVLWPDRHEFIAIDEKTASRTHGYPKGLEALHALSAYAHRHG